MNMSKKTITKKVGLIYISKKKIWGLQAFTHQKFLDLQD